MRSVFRISLLIVLAATLCSAEAIAQDRRALDHSDYERWRSISDQRLSADGAWATWREAPDEVGDGRVVIKRTNGRNELNIPRGDNPRFAGDYVVALVHPPYDSTRQARIAEKKGDDLPADSVAVLNLRDGSISMHGPASGFKVPDDGAPFAAVLLKEESETERDSTLAESPHDKKDGNVLHLLDLRRGDAHPFPSVTAYAFSDDGAWLVYSAQSKSGEADGVFAVSTSDREPVTVLSGEGFYESMALADQGDQLAFVSNVGDFASDQPEFTLYTAALGEPAIATVSSSTPGVPDGWWVSEHASLDFSDSGQRLFLGTAPRPAPEVEDARPDDEKVPVDIWSWTDKRLMTVQLVNQRRDRERSFAAALDLTSGRVAQLANAEVPDLVAMDGGDRAYAFGRTTLPHMPEGSWDTPGRADIYAINMATGDRRLILEGIRSRPEVSPDGDRLAWWDGEERVWKITSWSSRPNTVLTTAVSPPEGIRFENELHDSPAIPGSNGSVGWTADGSWFLFNDRYDIWGVNADGETWRATGETGRSANQRLRHVQLDREAHFVDIIEPLLLSTFDYQDKSAGFASAQLTPGQPASVNVLIDEPRRFSTPAKAEDSNTMLLTRQTYSEFGDLWATDPSFSNWTRLSEANPHQSEYRWGSVELVDWTSTDGEQLQGLLYKPEGFDAAQQYPMMVYFYERSTDGLHSYQTPAPGRSVINRTFYASRGYLVFVPDIPYKDGYPGESAMNAVMPGVTGLIDQGFVDPARVGVQGHSWGGYQIAYMITRTNLFAAAEAGAPVANMFSAYGGIRWQTGLNRAFQYERTQSRIGGSIWEQPLRFIENSPLFWLDKVETPLLIMHNDADGHVPWYQGIELFIGMRRLGKPVWLLNYNGEPHWPLPYWKRMDFTMRLQQYFDHYLMDAPAPKWLSDGVPAVDKGRDWGLELPADLNSDRGN